MYCTVNTAYCITVLYNSKISRVNGIVSWKNEIFKNDYKSILFSKKMAKTKRSEKHGEILFNKNNFFLVNVSKYFRSGSIKMDTHYATFQAMEYYFAFNSFEWQVGMELPKFPTIPMQ